MSNTKTEAQRLAEFKDLEYWPAGVGLTDWVESVCAEMLRLDAALADELNNRDVLDKMLTQCITERDQLRAQVERLQGGPKGENDPAWTLAAKVREALDRKACPGYYMDVAVEAVVHNYTPAAPSQPDEEVRALQVMRWLDSGEWTLTKSQPSSYLTDEANAEHAWFVERQAVPYCDNKGRRRWFGRTAFEAVTIAIASLSEKERV